MQADERTAPRELPRSYSWAATVEKDDFCANPFTGTVVINGAVRISPAAVSHGRLTVAVHEDPQVSQPAPLSRGQTTAVPRSRRRAVEDSLEFTRHVGDVLHHPVVGGHSGPVHPTSARRPPS